MPSGSPWTPGNESFGEFLMMMVGLLLLYVVTVPEKPRSPSQIMKRRLKWNVSSS